MSSKKYLSNGVLIFLSLGFLILSGILVMPAVQAQNMSKSSALELFMDVYSITSTTYVDSLSDAELVEAAVRGMLENLDPNSMLLTPDQLENLTIQLEGTFEGIGVTIGQRDDWLTIISPIEGSPAHRIGVRGGDRIVEINEETTEGMSTEEAVSILRGPEGTEVSITVVRAGVQDSINFDIIRGVIDYPSVSAIFMVNENTGYIRLSRFSEESAREVVIAIKDLELEGAENIILDLRNNSGGLFIPAIEVSDIFLPSRTLVVTTKGNAVGERDYRTDRGILFNGDLVVLVDGGSASSSEIVAGALQDHGVATIIGTRTFGKGSIQRLSDLGDYPGLGHYVVKLTTARYYTPSGNSIDRTLREDFLDPEASEDWGIIPDISVELPEISLDLLAELEFGGYFFRFAAAYTVEHDELDESFWPDEEVVQEFKSLLVEEELIWDEQEFQNILSYIHRGILREVALRNWSIDTYYRILAPHDEFIQAAILFLEEND